MRIVLSFASMALMVGVALATPGCDLARAAIHAPAHAMRSEAPPGIEARALAVGAAAPAFSLAGADGARHELGEILARGPAVLVFYRGFW